MLLLLCHLYLSLQELELGKVFFLLLLFIDLRPALLDLLFLPRKGSPVTLPPCV